MSVANGPDVSGLRALPTEPVEGGWIVHTAEVRVVPACAPLAFFVHGWHTFSATDWVPVDRPRAPLAVTVLQSAADDPAHATETRLTGSGVGAVVDHDGEVLLLGALGTDARVVLDEGRLVGYAAEETPWFVARGERTAVFAAYARALGDRLGRRQNGSLRLWSSWYSFYQDITESRLQAVLDDVRTWPIDVFQVDDGWQQEIGDWEANDAFRSGMPALAGWIRDAGLRAGIWLAPFIASPRSRLVADHPDWLLTDTAGAPVRVGFNWGDWFYALDLTRTDVLDHLAEVISSVRRWGFDMLKLDFLYAGAVPGTRSDPGPREASYRRAIHRVREAAGEDAYLLGCGAPIIASVGVFDALRISTDVAPYWDNPVLTQVVGATSEVATRGAITTTLHRLWLQEVVATDPDVVFFRSRYNLMDAEQRRWLQDLATVAGVRGTSDPPGWLDTDERDALCAYLAADEPVVHLGDYRYRIGEREVDFAPLAKRPFTLAQMSRPNA